MRWILIILMLFLAACGSGDSRARALDQHLAAEIDAIEASLKQARDSETERAAISEMNRKCMDLKLSPVIEASDPAGVQIPTSDWDKHRDRLKGARVQINFTLRNGLIRAINHTLIDPENFPYFLMGE